MTTYLTAPDGSRWAVVPVKPSKQMAMAALRCAMSEEIEPGMWAVMLAAAPAFPGETAEAAYKRGLREGLEMAAEEARAAAPIYAASDHSTDASRAISEALHGFSVHLSKLANQDDELRVTHQNPPLSPATQAKEQKE